jgi:hypothetical protein
MTSRSVFTSAAAIILSLGLSSTGTMESQQVSTPAPGGPGRDFIVRIDPPVAGQFLHVLVSGNWPPSRHR